MAVATELVLVRHGEAVCNVTGVVGGERGCTGLSPRGRGQAARLATRLAAEHRQRPFDAWYASPLRRVHETAEIVGADLPLAVTLVHDLRGPDHGDADGSSWHEVRTAFGGRPQHDPGRPYAPGAETWNRYLDRTTTVLQAILDRHAGQRILVVAHGETVEAAGVLLLRLPAPARTGVGFITDHTGIARWQQHVDHFDRHVWMLAAHNDTGHLTHLTDLTDLPREPRTTPRQPGVASG